MKTVTIDRSKWVRNISEDVVVKNGNLLISKTAAVLGDTSLLNDNGNMCCLGFICHQAGVPKTLLNNQGFPDALEHKRMPKYLVEGGCNTDVTTQAASINDTFMDGKTRERKLKALFKDHVKLEFVGKTPRV